MTKLTPEQRRNAQRAAEARRDDDTFELTEYQTELIATVAALTHERKDATTAAVLDYLLDTSGVYHSPSQANTAFGVLSEAGLLTAYIAPRPPRSKGVAPKAYKLTRKGDAALSVRRARLEEMTAKIRATGR